MVATPSLSVHIEQAPIASLSHQPLGPQRALACAITLVALAAGCFVSLHLLGVLNLLFRYPAIAPNVVVLTSLAGTCLSLLLLHRIGIVDASGLIERCSIGPSKAVKVILPFAVVPYAVLFLVGLFSFPDGWDALAYHLDTALKWLQSGTMRLNPAFGWQYSLPSNGELPALIAFSAGLPRAVTIGNLFAVVLLATSVYLIAWKITHQSTPSTLAAVAAITLPMVIFQAFELFVDMFGTAFLMAAIALMIWRERSPLWFTFLAGCAAGIAIGSKPIFWVYAAIFGSVSLGSLWCTKRQCLKSILLLVGGMILLSGFWFFRSAQATGNPAYPMRLSIGQHVIFRGYARADYPSDGFRSLGKVLTAPWSDPPLLSELSASLPSSVSGTGPLFAAIALPGVLFLVVQVLMQRASRTERALLLATAAAFLLWDTALLRVLRFGLPVMVLSCTLAAPMIQTLIEKSGRLPILLFVAGVLLNSLYCLTAPVQRIVHRIQCHDWSRATFYGYPPIIDRLPQGTRILDCTGWGRTFMLAGARLTNYVLPRGDPRSVDYVVKAGPADSDDIALRLIGATLIYDATPPSLYAGVAQPWRVYRVHEGVLASRRFKAARAIQAGSSCPW